MYPALYNIIGVQGVLWIQELLKYYLLIFITTKMELLHKFSEFIQGSISLVSSNTNIILVKHLVQNLGDTESTNNSSPYTCMYTSCGEFGWKIYLGHYKIPGINIFALT